jgi:2,4-dienoyl-CoA reductase-like NADH-dependent reductase (Old Yellow Enzyme family)
MIFEPITIKGTTFKNRILRSSMGGKTSYYDGSFSNAAKNFERRFARGGVGGIVSATITVDDHRWSPLEYPKMTKDKFIEPLREAARAVQSFDCRYIVQLGDHGYHTQTSLFSERADELSASDGFDLAFGYRSFRSAMSTEDIEQVIENFAQAARRVRESGCDGLEITASKGYLIHQFLNPAINHRTDQYGGSVDKRFRLLEEIVNATRKQIGSDFLLGVKLSARDFNFSPLNVRLPIAFPLRDWWFGNDLPVTIKYGRRLKELGVDYLHVTNGFGFVNPRESPGRFPAEEWRLLLNATRHLSRKAAIRATIFNTIPRLVRDHLLNIGWGFRSAPNLADAAEFKRQVGLPVIANGGFQSRSVIETALADQRCDLVAMARPLLANPDLVEEFRAGREMPARPCNHCNRCSLGTGTLPLGCYEPARFSSVDEMERQIIELSGNPDPLPA